MYVCMYVMKEELLCPWEVRMGVMLSPMQSLFFMNLAMLYQPEVCWTDPFSLSTASALKTSFCWDGPLGSSIGGEFKSKG